MSVSLETMNSMFKKKLDGSGIVVHSLYRRVKMGLAGKEFHFTGMTEKGDKKKYFDVILQKDSLPDEREAEAMVDDIIVQLKASYGPVILMN